jgi:tetratricopeptide (TPR) repeat protein
MKDKAKATELCQLTLAAMVFFGSILTGPASAQSDIPTYKQSDPVGDYLDAIDAAEAELSAYSLELSDLYLGLGKSHLSNREYDRARKAFQLGMQIERVNFGLNSLTQTPYLMSIAETESFLGNWDESQKALENLYIINTEAYGAQDPRMLPVLNELLDWYLDTYSDRSTSGGYQNLVISEKLSTRMQSILNQTEELKDPAAPKMYRKISHLHYFIANHIKKHGDSSEAGFTFNASSTTSSANSTSHMHYRRGKVALQKVVESLELREDTPALDQASAIAELGDWYLVFGQRASANQTYKLAYDFLGDSEQSEALQESFFSDAKLIGFTDQSSAAKRYEKANSGVPIEEPMEISMTISTNGVPRNVEIVNPPEDLGKNVRRAVLTDIRAQRYRPKLAAGAPVSSAIQFPYDIKPTNATRD